MSKYHINKRGAAALCRAEHACPLGSPDEHFSTPREAYEAFQLRMGDQTVAPVVKKAKPSKADQYRKTIEDARAEKRTVTAAMRDLNSRTVNLKRRVKYHREKLAEIRAAYSQASTGEEKRQLREAARKSQDKLGPLQEELKPFLTEENKLGMRLVKLNDKIVRAQWALKREPAVGPTVALPELQHFSVGSHFFPRAVIAFAPKQNVPAGAHNMAHVIVPLSGSLTAKRRLSIGRAVWAASGRDVADWDGASEDKRDEWAKMHMGRHFNVGVKADHGQVSWASDGGSANNYDSDDVSVYEVRDEA